MGRLTIDPDDRDAIKDLTDGIWHRLSQGASDREAVEGAVRALAKEHTGEAVGLEFGLQLDRALRDRRRNA